MTSASFPNPKMQTTILLCQVKFVKFLINNQLCYSCILKNCFCVVFNSEVKYLLWW